MQQGVKSLCRDFKLQGLSSSASSTSIANPQLPTERIPMEIRRQNGLTAVPGSAGPICAQGLVIRTFDPILNGVPRKHKTMHVATTPRASRCGVERLGFVAVGQRGRHSPLRNRRCEYASTKEEFQCHLPDLELMTNLIIWTGYAFTREMALNWSRRS